LPPREDDDSSMASTCSRTHLTNRTNTRPFSQTPSYSTVKMNQSSNNLEPQVSFRPHGSSRPSPRSTARSKHSSAHSVPHTAHSVPHSARETPRSNLDDASLDNREKYDDKRILEDLGLSEKDFRLNLPGVRMNKLSSSPSDDEELGPRTALEDTLMEGDPLAYTTLSNEVLRSPETMRALAKFRAGARKHGPSKHDNPDTEEFELKQQNRVLSDHRLEDVRNAYKAGYRRPLPPNINNHL